MGAGSNANNAQVQPTQGGRLRVLVREVKASQRRQASTVNGRPEPGLFPFTRSTTRIPYARPVQGRSFMKIGLMRKDGQ